MKKLILISSLLVPIIITAQLKGQDQEDSNSRADKSITIPKRDCRQIVVDGKFHDNEWNEAIEFSQPDGYRIQFKADDSILAVGLKFPKPMGELVCEIRFTADDKEVFLLHASGGMGEGVSGFPSTTKFILNNNKLWESSFSTKNHEKEAQYIADGEPLERYDEVYNPRDGIEFKISREKFIGNKLKFTIGWVRVEIKDGKPVFKQYAYPENYSLQNSDNWIELILPSAISSTILTGPYLGQKTPGIIPELFASEIVSTKEREYAFEVSISGNEILFMRNNQIMIATKSIDGTWNMPEIAPFSGSYIDDEPCFSPDGSKIYFMSRRPAKGSNFRNNLWVVEKQNGKWGEPGLVRLPLLLKQLHAPSISSNHTIYDDGISIIQFKDGNYLNQKNIPGLTGMYPFVVPDESFIIYSAGYSGNTGADLYVSFKDKNSNWSKGISLGDEINSSKHEGNSFVSADSKYLFFSRDGDIYWVSSKIIDELRPKE